MLGVSCFMFMLQLWFFCSVSTPPQGFGKQVPNAAFLVVKRHPFADDPLGVEAIVDFLKVNGLLFQRPPKPFDEDVVEETTSLIHGYFDTGFA